jgi:hypothetical protein
VAHGLVATNLCKPGWELTIGVRPNAGAIIRATGASKQPFTRLGKLRFWSFVGTRLRCAPAFSGYFGRANPAGRWTFRNHRATTLPILARGTMMNAAAPMVIDGDEVSARLSYPD